MNAESYSLLGHANGKVVLPILSRDFWAFGFHCINASGDDSIALERFKYADMTVFT
jgi:hypothetical protein